MQALQDMSPNSGGRGRAIYQEIRARLHAQTYAPGTRLPAERSLCLEFEVARVTVQQILKRLEAEGLIYREDRRGWFVSPPCFLYNPQKRGHFGQAVLEQGRRPATDVLSMRVLEPPEIVRNLLNLAPGTELACISRIRAIDGRPVLYVEHYLQPDVFPGLFAHDLSGSMTELYAERYGFHYGRMTYQIIPTALSGEAAVAMRVADGSPGLLVTRVNHARDSDLRDCDLEYWRHDGVLVEVDVEAAPLSCTTPTAAQ